MSQTIVVDVPGHGRTGWVQVERGRPGRFIGEFAVQAGVAVRNETVVEIASGVVVIASDLRPSGAVGAMVAAAGENPWQLVEAPAALYDLLR